MHSANESRQKVSLINLGRVSARLRYMYLNNIKYSATHEISIGKKLPFFIYYRTSTIHIPPTNSDKKSFFLKILRNV